MVHAEELSRRISELNLTSYHSASEVVVDGRGPRYELEELTRLRPLPEPNAPPPTPATIPASPIHAPTKDLRSMDNVVFHAIAELDKDGTKTENKPSTINGSVGVDATTQKKEKKNKKSSGKNRLPPVTGFEDYYADAPLTPAEHDAESEIYATTRPFADRIEACIQRYRHKRKLDSTRANAFTKWLMLGGIDASTSKQFTGGLDKDTLEQATADEIAAIRATDHIRSGARNAKFYDPDKPEGWTVDFTGVMKGFLILQAFDVQSKQDVKALTAVLRNFLNYVLSHNVCPEYEDDIIEARRICGVAEQEIPRILMVRRYLPGDFNLAASSLYGDYSSLKENAVPSCDWTVVVNPGYEQMKAEYIFKTAIAFAGNDELFEKAMGFDVSIVKSERKPLEICEIRRAPAKIVEDCAKNDTRNEHGTIDTKPLGLIVCKAWSGSNLEPEDTTDDEDNAPIADSGYDTFWLEDDALEHCFIGMKLEVMVHELNIGLKFFNNISGIYCSYFEFLPNEKMTLWKEPLPNERPPPNECDPHVEEQTMQAIMEREQQETEKDMLTEKNDTSNQPATQSPTARIL